MRTLSEIANEAMQDMMAQSLKAKKQWNEKFVYAAPYLRALRTMDKISDNYGADEGVKVVRYFLSNATTWRGPVAIKIKHELRDILRDM